MRSTSAAPAQAIEAYSIHGAAPGTAARLLSGGNAQKLLLAADAGTACVLISEDLEEMLALSTTIAVISRGSLLGLLTGIQHPSASEIRSRMDNLLRDHS